MDYFSKSIPKSMDNSWVQAQFIPVLEKYQISIEDQLATMVQFIVEQLGKDIREHLNSKTVQVKTALITGGGAHNVYLIQILEKCLEALHINVQIPNEETINFKEANLISLMGYLRVLKLPNTIPSVTGATRPTSGGAIYWPID